MPIFSYQIEDHDVFVNFLLVIETIFCKYSILSDIRGARRPVGTDLLIQCKWKIHQVWVAGSDKGLIIISKWCQSSRTGLKIMTCLLTSCSSSKPSSHISHCRYENGEQEHCLELWNRDGKGLRWNDTPCSFETFFVCEVWNNKRLNFVKVQTKWQTLKKEKHCKCDTMKIFEKIKEKVNNSASQQKPENASPNIQDDRFCPTPYRGTMHYNFQIQIL